MRQSGQAMTIRSVNMSTGGGSIEEETTSRSLLSSANAAVNRALAPADSTRTIGSSAESTATGNRHTSSEGYNWNRGVAAPVVSLPPPKVPAPHMVTFRALQEWEGYVVSIEDDAFVARLVDLTAGTSHESEEATIPLDEISDRDAASMKLGSIFRWVIGHEWSPEGTRKRVSQIVFRDLPMMTEGDLQAGREWAGKISSAINP